MFLHKSVKAIFIGSLALSLWAVWQSESLPEPKAIREELRSEPVQRVSDSPAFSTRVGGVKYSIQPRFTYDLYGVVVSRHDAAAWWDYAHKEWNDNLNVVDLCVVWGENVLQDAYRKINYSHDQWTCWYQTHSSDVIAAFDSTAFSNNHLITDNPQLANALRTAKVGDQVHVRGYLADYTIVDGKTAGFKRVSSTVRSDTGNGACEVIYVKSFEVIQAGGGNWRRIKWIAAGVFVFSILLWFHLPVRVYR